MCPTRQRWQKNGQMANGKWQMANGNNSRVDSYDNALAKTVAMTNPSAVSYTPSIATTSGYIFSAKNAGDVRNFVVRDGNQAFVSVPAPFGVNAMGAITHAYGGSIAT
jgi:filamentous hemagglutinin